MNGQDHRLFRREDGLTSTDCNPFSTWTDADGGVWFGSTAGLLHHPPDQGLQAQHLPETLFVSFRLGSRLWEHPFAGPLDLGAVPFRDSTLTAHFTSLTFEHEGRLRFQSRLTGLDDGWVDIPSRDLRYSALSPGRYRLEVRALIEDGGAGPVASAAFRVLHPWWLRWWAWPVWAGLAVCAGVAMFHWRVRVLEKRNEELKVLVYQRTEALELSNLALATISTTDPLTGLRNRRYLEEELPPVLALVLRAQRDHLGTDRHSSESCLVFAMLDLDHFKRVNDTYSHAAGDLALKQVADILRREARESDFLVRWGGEEILFVGHTSDLDGAATVVARLHQALREHAFDLGCRNPWPSPARSGFPSSPSRRTTWRRLPGRIRSAWRIAVSTLPSAPAATAGWAWRHGPVSRPAWPSASTRGRPSAPWRAPWNCAIAPGKGTWSGTEARLAVVAVRIHLEN